MPIGTRRCARPSGAGADWLLLVAALAAAPHAVPGQAQGCSDAGGGCICTDAAGNSWDVSKLDVSNHEATGPTDGCLQCSGEWNYHFDFCKNVDIPQSIGCSPAGETRLAYRIDEFTTPTSRFCEYLGPDVASDTENILVGELTGQTEGIQLTYTYLSRSLRVNLICDPSAPADSVPQPVAVGGNLVDIK